MAKTDENTRQVTQYRVLTLYSNADVVISKNAVKGEKKIQKRLPVAVFTDSALLETYKKKQKKADGHISYEVGEDWVEFKPDQSRFSMPFNPVPNAPVAKEKEAEDTKENGTD